MYMSAMLKLQAGMKGARCIFRAEFSESQVINTAVDLVLEAVQSRGGILQALVSRIHPDAEG